MKNDEVKELHELRGLCYKGDFLQNLSDEEFNEGLIKFEIPDDEKDGANISERVWGWVTKEDKEKYNDDNFRGEIKVILANDSLNYSWILFWGTELVIECNGSNRPVLSSEWIQDNVLSKDWYQQ